MPTTNCQKCGAEIPPQAGRQQPRKYCEACRPPRNRPNPRVIELPNYTGPTDALAEAVGAAAPRTGLVDALRRQLEAAGRLDTPEGALVMELAELMAAGRGKHTASGAAALSRELRAALVDALKHAEPEGDVIDLIFGEQDAG